MFANGPRGVVVLAGGVLALTLSVFAQTQAPPPAQPPAAGAPGAQAPGAAGFPGRGAPMWEADFSKKGTVPVLSPADEAKKFWLPPGYKLEPVLTDPDIAE